MRSVTTDTAVRRPRPSADGELPDCKDCPTFRDAHHRALADRRGSADYLRILAGSGQVDQWWVERLIVAADELESLGEQCRILDAENNALTRVRTGEGREDGDACY